MAVRNGRYQMMSSADGACNAWSYECTCVILGAYLYSPQWMASHKWVALQGITDYTLTVELFGVYCYVYFVSWNWFWIFTFIPCLFSNSALLHFFLAISDTVFQSSVVKIQNFLIFIWWCAFGTVYRVLCRKFCSTYYIGKCQHFNL